MTALCLFAAALAACAPPAVVAQEAAPPNAAAAEAAPQRTETAPAPVEPAAGSEEALPSPAPTQDDAPAPTPTAAPAPFDPETWGELPVIPEIGARAVEILQHGLAKGRSPNAFSKIGDCESQASWFLGDFDLGPEVYSLGSYEDELAPVIEQYAGSFERTSLAAKPGFTAASLLAPIWADRKLCEKNETPLACEYRVHNPLVAFILIGTNDASNPKTFEGHMRKVIEYSIAQGVLPVLGTKADNVEGDHRINITVARLAHEYGLPLWNYWSAVQPLPGNGLQEDGVHLTFAAPHFDDPEAMRRAWPVRNLNALQVLRRVMDAYP